MRREVEVGTDAERRRVVAETRRGNGPPVVWFGGFRSDMRSTKVEAIDAWAGRDGRALIRFDYSGHGESGGRFEDGTISRWLEEGLAVLRACTAARPILVGSSMGAWIATLVTLRLAADAARRPAGLVLIAPAIDFTERLMWDLFPDDVRRTLAETGRYLRPSLYSDEPYPIALGLIDDGRRHLLLDGPIEPCCPVHVIQGMRDPDVPFDHAMRFVERLPGEGVQLTIVKDGDHRLSRPQDLDRIVRAIEAMAGPARAGDVSSG